MKGPVIRILGDALGDMLYPDDIRCMVCGRDIPVKNRLCLCRDCVLPENTEFCLGCGRALLHGGVYCDVCQREKHPFAAARAPLVYEDAAKTLIRRLKYGNARYLAPYLGSLMAETWLMSRHTAQAVAFVPMHRSRERRRGYNQAELLARSVAEALQLPLISPLERTANTPFLARMDREARFETIRDAIACLAPVGYASVLLVDDVFTTGATAAACAAALKKNGAKEVFVLTAATARQEKPPVSGRKNRRDLSACKPDKKR